MAREYKRWRRLLQMPHQVGVRREGIGIKKTRTGLKVAIDKSPWWIKESQFNWLRPEEIDLKRLKLIPQYSIPGPHLIEKITN